MPGFNYTAIDRNGKRVRSSLDASSIETAKSSLRGAGYTILDIKEQTTLNRDIEIPFLGNPKAKDMAVFCRQFVSILRAGVSVASVLAMLGQQTSNKKLRAAIREMQADVEKGEALATSMRRHPKIFPAILVNMVSAGEASGNLEESFRQMELYFERSKRTKSKVTSAMIYPCVLIVVMIVVLIVMMTKIIPNFLKTFEDMDAELPKITLGVMAVCEWFKSWWWVPLLVLAALIVGGVLFHRTNKGKHFFGWLARKTPVVGNLTVKTACATFCRTMEVLIGSGLTLTDSMDLAASNMGNIYYLEAIRDARALVAEGTPLRESLVRTGIFPPMVSNLVGVGEETGDLQSMMGKVADYYDEEVDEATKKLLNLMEPAIIIVMAVFVVIIVLAIYLPMINMTKAFDKYL
ncbi:MAG: type II secretion system F family protein [Oscillibacter sp.]|nr:type II secretion system F family protein [Oscillibacter sp.]